MSELDGKPLELHLKTLPPVRGYIRDMKGQPLAHVFITAHNCLPLTETDVDGHFAIPGVEHSAPLSFTKEGYAWLDWSFTEGDMEIGRWSRVPRSVLRPRRRRKPGADARVQFHAPTTPTSTTPLTTAVCWVLWVWPLELTCRPR